MGRVKGADRSSPPEPRSIARPSSTGLYPAEDGKRYGDGSEDRDRKNCDLEESSKWDEV